MFAVLARLFVHWLGTGLPLTLLAPVLGSMLALLGGALARDRGPGPGYADFGAPWGVGAALTVSLRSGGAPRRSSCCRALSPY